MAFNFPNTPTVGSTYTPAGAQVSYNWDGAKWVTGAGGASANAVRYDIAQNLTPPQQTQGRQNVAAAPFDAMAYNGMQINGNMEVSQLYGNSSIAFANGTVTYAIDGWQVGVNGCAVSTQQVTDAPPGYAASLKISVTTADAAPAATDYCQIFQNFEYCRTARLAFGTVNAFPVSLAFWAKANRPGTYSAVIKGASYRTYPFSFTINASATWQYITVTIPGDQSGAWAVAANATGLMFNLAIMSGSTYLLPANQWQSVNGIGVTGSINGAAATTDYFQIAGFVILPGIELPSATRAPFIMRSIDLEMQTCRRYIYNGCPPVKGYVNATNLMRLSARHPVLMRAAPNLILATALPVYDGTTPTTMTSIGTNESTPEVLEFEGVAAASMTGKAVGTYQGAGGNLIVDARL